jgi:hypothetical protein
MRSSPPLSLNKLSSRAKRGICIAWIVLTVGLVLGQNIVPTGWRRITQAEAADDWRQKHSTRFLLVKGDFDGDGKPDVAELLLNPGSNRFALFVRLASTSKWERLGEPIDAKNLDRFGIDFVKPRENTKRPAAKAMVTTRAPMASQISLRSPPPASTSSTPRAQTRFSTGTKGWGSLQKFL